jgi:SAM-dependent methyltransferase
VTATTGVRERRLERIKSALACPYCHSDLQFGDDAASCLGCGRRYPIRDYKVFFIDVPKRGDDFDRIKGWLKKRLGRGYYTIGVNIIAPTFPLNFARRILRHVDPTSALVVDAGSGNHRVHPDMICIDIFDYDAVDLVCTLDALPFRSGALDAVVSRSVLEHVGIPNEVVAEFHRCTRPGGIGIHMIPFMYPFHASPGDYHRFTHRGQELLFKEWTMVERTNPSGPVTVALLLVLETISTLFSANREPLKSIVYLLLCAVLFPLKFLDAPFVGRPAFMGCAASILSVVRKTG